MCVYVCRVAETKQQVYEDSVSTNVRMLATNFFLKLSEILTDKSLNRLIPTRLLFVFDSSGRVYVP